jgi:large subunit ribosomal protein L3
MKGILGRKVGMTQVFATDGKLIPVTVIEVEPNVVTQIKTVEKDGYNAIQLGAFNKKVKSSNKPEIGHLKKSKTEPKRFLKEIRGLDVSNYEVGQVLSSDVFASGEIVDVTGTSKGKGFAGPIKRHGLSRGPETHGSTYHRRAGSLGPMRPMRVLKGKPLAGQMGNEQVTVQNLEIVDVNTNDNYILVSGNVPGPKKGLVLIKSSVKNKENNSKKELVSYEIIEEEINNVEPTIEEKVTEEVISEEAINESEVVEEAATEEKNIEETPSEEVKEETLLEESKEA